MPFAAVANVRGKRYHLAFAANASGGETKKTGDRPLFRSDRKSGAIIQASSPTPSPIKSQAFFGKKAKGPPHKPLAEVVEAVAQHQAAGFSPSTDENIQPSDKKSSAAAKSGRSDVYRSRRSREKSVCKRRSAVTLKRSLNVFCPHTLMARRSPPSAQPAWERLRAASRR